jgi:hypothetical protein
MRVKATLLAGLGLLLGSVWPVSAATVTYHISFTATPIQFDFGGGTTTPPVDPVIGAFTIKFNPAHDYSADTTVGIKLDSLNLDLGSKLAFRYSHAFDILQIGGKRAGVSGFDLSPSNDFYLEIDGITGASPSSTLLRYIQTASGDSQFTTGSIGLTFGTPAPPATAPIPGALPLFLTAIATLGLWRYGVGRRRIGVLASMRCHKSDDQYTDL